MGLCIRPSCTRERALGSEYCYVHRINSGVDETFESASTATTFETDLGAFSVPDTSTDTSSSFSDTTPSNDFSFGGGDSGGGGSGGNF